MLVVDDVSGTVVMAVVTSSIAHPGITLVRPARRVRWSVRAAAPPLLSLLFPAIRFLMKRHSRRTVSGGAAATIATGAAIVTASFHLDKGVIHEAWESSRMPVY